MKLMLGFVRKCALAAEWRRCLCTSFAALLVSVQPALSQSSLQLDFRQSMGSVGVDRQQVGKRFTFVCPGGDRPTATLYGTDVYSDSSPICLAAIHAGALTPGVAGVVTIVLGAGVESLTGSERHGVTTRSYGRWGYTFTFAHDSAPATVTWRTTWNWNLRPVVDIAEPIAVECPPGGKIDVPIYGTDAYSLDSPICVAAVHAGAITAEQGGVVTVRRVPAPRDDPGAERFGIVSRRRGATTEAFAVSAGGDFAKPRPSQLPGVLPSEPAVSASALASSTVSEQSAATIADTAAPAPMLQPGRPVPILPAAEEPAPSSGAESAAAGGERINAAGITPGPVVSEPAPGLSPVMSGPETGTPSPVATNPETLSLQRQAPDRFTLSWTAVPGAVEYRVDGPPLPNAGLVVPGLSTTVSNVPGGPQTWQVVALFPGAVADYNTPTRASAVSRPLPAHPTWLTKSNGPGSESIAEAHGNLACQNRVLALKCHATFEASTNGDILNSYGLAAGGSSQPPAGEVTYTNVTELGQTRSANCFETTGQTDRFTICYVTHGVFMDMIIKADRGGNKFVQLGPTSWSDWNRRWELSYGGAISDSEGAKWAPHACLSCHGGTYDPGSGLVQGGTFLPIDPGLVQVANRPAQEESIRRINEVILRSGPSPAVATYITGMYAGMAVVPGTAAAANYVPPGWSSEANVYLGIVKKDCQMCHLATSPGLEFLSAGAFRANKALIYASVCQGKSMPHAEVPFKRFWQEDTGALYMPGVFAAWLGYPSCQ